MVPAELLDTAVRAYLRQIEREQIAAEAAAFRAMHDELSEKFLGQYVAISHGELVDHDLDFQALHRRVRHRYGHRSVLLRLVEAEPEREMRFRSPRFERVCP